MDKVAGSGYDEFYTPEYAVKPIIKYIKPNSTIWCPFDTDKSHFVKMLRVEGHNVIYSHDMASPQNLWTQTEESIEVKQCGENRVGRRALGLMRR